MILIFIGVVGILVASTSVLIFSSQKELECLRLYKDIHELSSTTEMKLAEQQAIDLHKSLVFEYVERNCPNFTDLDFIYKTYTGNELK